MENKHEQSLDLTLAISEALDIALDHPDRKLDPAMSGVLAVGLHQGEAAQSR